MPLKEVYTVIGLLDKFRAPLVMKKHKTTKIQKGASPWNPSKSTFNSSTLTENAWWRTSDITHMWKWGCAHDVDWTSRASQFIRGGLHINVPTLNRVMSFSVVLKMQPQPLNLFLVRSVTFSSSLICPPQHRSPDLTFRTPTWNNEIWPSSQVWMNHHKRVAQFFTHLLLTMLWLWSQMKMMVVERW